MKALGFICGSIVVGTVVSKLVGHRTATGKMAQAFVKSLKKEVSN